MLNNNFDNYNNYGRDEDVRNYEIKGNSYNPLAEGENFQNGEIENNTYSNQSPQTNIRCNYNYDYNGVEDNQQNTYSAYNGAYALPHPKAKKRKSGMFVALTAAALVCSFGMGLLGSTVGNLLGRDNQTINGGLGQPSSIVSTGTGTGGEMSVADITKMTADSVVEITTESVTTGDFFQQQIKSGAGSGVIISQDGYIATNNHVVEGSNKITVTMRDGTQHSATLVGTDSKTDLAVIKINATGLIAAVMGSSSNLSVGELAVVIGNPLGQLGGTVTDGIISALDREITVDGEVMNLLQTNAAINAGNSGGGLFNSKGELVGIINAKSSGEGVEGLGFAIPIDTAKTVINDIIQYGHVQGRISLGMSLVNIDDAQTAMMYRVNSLGVYVLSVENGSSAQTAGLQAGDKIVSIDSTQVSTTAEVSKIIDSKKVGDTVSMTIERSGRTGTVEIVLQQDNGNASNA